jgi:hypothetical protein
MGTISTAKAEPVPTFTVNRPWLIVWNPNGILTAHTWTKLYVSTSFYKTDSQKVLILFDNYWIL